MIFGGIVRFSPSDFTYFSCNLSRIGDIKSKDWITDMSRHQHCRGCVQQNLSMKLRYRLREIKLWFFTLFPLGFFDPAHRLRWRRPVKTGKHRCGKRYPSFCFGSQNVDWTTVNSLRPWVGFIKRLHWSDRASFNHCRRSPIRQSCRGQLSAGFLLFRKKTPKLAPFGDGNLTLYLFEVIMNYSTAKG